VNRRLRLVIFAVALGLLAAGVAVTQPKVALPKAGKLPEATLTTPLQPPPAEGGATVTPGPEPWYTLFATGEVVGYIEPCG
jgi:hypothetical protein